MSRARILIVEDERITAMSLQAELHELGYEVTALASSGQEAIARANCQRPDLVVMDIRLDGSMSGIEAAKRIRELHDIPIVFLTAYSSEDIRVCAEQAGPCGYVLKPYDTQALDETIRRTLNLQLLQKGAQR
jgi:CheY-like chemotaxis protein